MQFALVHLSDIHLKETGNHVVGKIDALVAAARSECLLASGLFVVVTGDVAFSGKRAEYEVAKELLGRVVDGLRSEHVPVVLVVTVPGNHDCDFDLDTAARRILISNVVSAAQGPADAEPDASVVEICMRPQDEFFEFLAALDRTGVRRGTERLLYHYDPEVKLVKFRFNCYNTAWLSQIHEKQQLLHFPIGRLQDDHTSSALVISLFHHPYSWLNADNARALRKHVERTSDVILSGHEHESDIFTKHGVAGERPTYVEGAVLQAAAPSDSGFNVVTVDLANRRWKAVQFDWTPGESMFKPRRTPEWQEFLRGKFLRTNQLDNTPMFAEYLEDPGAAFTHPRVRTLRLRDIFVFPDVDDYPVEGGLGSEVVYGDTLNEYMKKHRYLMILGSDLSGRTALLKTVYANVQGRETVPLLISGVEIGRAKTEDAVLRLIDRSVAEQYGSDAVDRYRQLPMAARVALVDDFHRAKLTAKRRTEVIDIFVKSFDRVVLTTDELFLLEERADEPQASSATFQFHRCAIKPFGHRRRVELIEKWYLLGNDSAAARDTVVDEIERAAKTINTVVGRNLVPTFPLCVLGLLQSIEAHTGLSLSGGSYGHIYDALITAAFAKGRTRLTLDTKYTWVSMMAFRVFTSGDPRLTREMIEEVANEFFQTFGVRISVNEMIAELKECSVLNDVPGGVRFKYPYLYYYFVARYVQENLQQPSQTQSMRRLLREWADRVYNEEAANMLMFVLYLSKDAEVIESVLNNARVLFREYPVCDMDTHVRFITEQRVEVPALEYRETDTAVSRHRHYRYLDDAETMARTIDGEEDMESTEEAERESQEESQEEPQDKLQRDLVTINVGVKTMQIMGQILRNFPGSLRREVKLEIARESIALGLRTLKVALEGVEEANAMFARSVEEFLRSEEGVTDEIRIRDKVSQFCFWLDVAVVAGFIKEIANAVGSEHLTETYEELSRGGQSIASKIVHLAIRLDHSRPTPLNDAVALNREVGGLVVPSLIIKGLVMNFLYLFPTDYAERQRVCQKLGIQIRPRMLVDRSQAGGPS